MNNYEMQKGYHIEKPYRLSIVEGIVLGGLAGAAIGAIGSVLFKKTSKDTIDNKL